MKRLQVVFLAILMSVFATAAGELYSEGQRALDQREWRRAASIFGELAGQGGDRADAALYYRAYAQAKQGQVEISLATLERLDDEFPDSSWRDDGEALRAELGRAAGSDRDDIRLMALFSLMESDPGRAMPYVKQLLDEDGPAHFKEEALFLLMQHGSSEATDVVTGIARGSDNPELQTAAIRSLGIAGNERTADLLAEIYRSAGDSAKAAVLESFMIAGQKEQLLEVARTETSENLRAEAIQYLAASGGGAELDELYRSETSGRVKQAIIEGYMISGQTERLAEIARDETRPGLRREAIEYLGAAGGLDELWAIFRIEQDPELQRAILEGLAIGGGSKYLTEVVKGKFDPELRAEAIRGLGIGGAPDPGMLVAIYENEANVEIRSAVLEALFVRNEVKSLIRLARQEKSLATKREIVEYLAVSGSEEATDFFLELLDE